MRKILTILMLLVLAVPMWAGEQTITISRNDGNISEGTGVYYAEKDGIVFQFSGGLDNEDYLLCMQQKQVIIRSYNYRIKKIVFHCVDNTVEGDDSFFWGPTTLSLVANQSTGGNIVGTYSSTAGSYIGTWTGTLPVNTQLTFESKARPVRFASIDVTYEKLEGDIFDLVTNNNQIVEGKSYIIVSQYHDKVMSFKKTDDTTHPSADIVEWPLGQDNKTKVKVDGEAKIFKLTAVKDSTVGSYTRKIAWLYDLNTYIREQSSNLITATSANDYARAIMYISSNEYNYLCWFKSGSSNSSHTIRYDYNNGLFKILDLNDSQQRVWLYKQSESYNVYTTCNPAEGGSIVLGDGVLDGTSQEGETVNFTVSTNTDYEIKNVTLESNGVTTVIEPDENGNYSFTMPGNDVTIRANFISPLYLIGTANGGEWHPYGPRFNYNNETDEYYIDVYFKGTGNYGDQTGDNWGEFRVTWLVNAVGDEDWSKIKNQGKQGHPYKLSVDPATGNVVCQNDGKYHLNDGDTYGLNYEWGDTEYYGQWTNQEDYKFTVDPGIYRIYVGTTASQNKGNLNENQLKIEKTPITLTFDPAGGATAAEAVEVPQNQLVSLQGDLYNKIKAINPDEADANFMYKATVDGSTTTSESAGASTTQIATLDVVNEGETVTKLEGWNYIGWIVASNTGYYKVIDTPLHWIEEFGKKDNTYTVSDRLQGVYAQEGHLWCKDLGNISIVKTEPVAGQIDYLAKTLKPEGHRFDNIRIGNWDQSNWVELDFTGLGTQSEAQAMAQALQGHYITAKSVTGVYTDDVNYTIKLKAQPTADGGASYVPNTYSPSNFIESNLMIDGNVGPVLPSNGVTYYFLNPKVQEYALITYAMWDKPQQIMVIPNNAPFNGAAKIGRWDLNNPNNQLEALDAAYEAPQTTNNVYEFHIIVQRANKTYGTPAPQVQGAPGLKDNNDIPHKPNQTTTGIIMAQPLDLLVSSPLPTAINRVGTEAQVVGVEYVNIAGMRSSKPFKGVNIVVTRYSDGSTTTSKVIK